MRVDAGNSDEALERSLIVRAKAGERDAFSVLIRHNIRRVYRAAYAVMRNRDDADDIAQETFVRAYQSISRFDETRPLFPWLYRIARNLCLNRIERVTERETELPEFDYLPDAAAGPEESAIAAEERTRVRNAVGRLPDQHRQIIQLSHFQECSYREIADILDVPIGTVMSRLHNARRKLRELLETDENGR
ncbi:MAG: RNA polymerase sigma factor [Spirochaetia bacterium]